MGVETINLKDFPLSFVHRLAHTPVFVSTQAGMFYFNGDTLTRVILMADVLLSVTFVLLTVFSNSTIRRVQCVVNLNVMLKNLIFVYTRYLHSTCSSKAGIHFLKLNQVM